MSIVKIITLFFFLFSSFSSLAQINLVYDVNDYVPPYLLDSRLYNIDSTKKISVYSLTMGVGENFSYKIKTLKADSLNSFLWINNGYYTKDFQFNFKLGSFLGVDTIGERKGVKSLTGIFFPKFQVGVYPLGLKSDSFGIHQLRLQVSWTPEIVDFKRIKNRYELDYGGNILSPLKHNQQEILQYVFLWVPNDKIFSYGISAYQTFLNFPNNHIIRGLDLDYAYFRANQNGNDKGSEFLIGIIAKLIYVKSFYNLFVYANYDNNYLSHKQLFKLGLFFQFPTVMKIIPYK